MSNTYFGKYFKKLDLFPQRVELLINQEQNHKTFLGAIMTICVTSLMSILFYYNMQELLAYSNVTSMMSEIYHSQPNSYPLNPTNFTIALALQHSNFSNYIDESIYIVDVTFRQKKATNGHEEWKTQTIELIQCSSDFIQQVDLKEYYNRLTLPSMYCLNLNSVAGLTLEGNFDAEIFKFIHFAVKICNERNRRIDGPQCREASEVTAALESNQIGIYLSSNTIDLKNLSNPHKAKGENIFTTTSSRMVKGINIYMQPLTTITDMGLVSDDQFTVSSLKYGHHTETLDIIQSDTFFNIAIRLDNVETVNYRQYDKIQNVIGQLGGLWNVLYLIALLLQKPFSYITYQLSIMNSMFAFQSEDMDVQNQNDSLIEDVQFDNQENIKSSRRINFLNQRSAQKLKQIIEKSNQIDSLTQRGNLKVKIAENISASIGKYFKIASKESQLHMKDYCYYLFGICCKYQFFNISINRIKQKQIEFAKQKINKQLDVLYIVSKLQEIDKLKMLVLEKEQLQVFDYLPKPTVPIDICGMALIQNQYFSILNPSKDTYERTLEAQRAFKILLQDPYNQINQKLLESIDFETAQLLKSRKPSYLRPQQQNSQSDEVNEENSKSIILPVQTHPFMTNREIRQLSA